MLLKVFNADETSLFGKRMKARTLLSKNRKIAPGFKAAKEKLTLLPCANAYDFMIKPMFVNKRTLPKTFKGKHLDH